MKKNNVYAIEEKEKNKEKALELFKIGYIQADIARELHMTDSAVFIYKKELIEEGKLKEEEIAKENNGNYGRVAMHKEKIPQIIDLLKQGTKPRDIIKILNISLKTYMSIIKYLKNNNIISKEEFEVALGREKNEEPVIFDDNIKGGYSLNSIIKENPNISGEKIEKILEILIREGKITPELIQRSIIEDSLNSKNTDKRLLEKENEKNRQNNVRHNKRMQTNTTNSKVRRRKKEENWKNSIEEIEKVKKYIEKGYKEYEITKLLGCSKLYLTKLVKEYSKENSWYTDEELNSFRTERNRREKEEENKYNEERSDEIREWIKKRKEMEARIGHHKQTNKKNVKEFSEDEISENIDKMYENFKEKAVKGYNAYISGNNKAVSNCRDFLNTLIIMEKKNIEPDIDGIKLAGSIVAECPYFAEKKYLRYIILQYNKLFGEETTIRYINRVIREQEDNVDTRKLEEFKIKIHEMGLKNKIQKMINKGENINEIAKKLNISYQNAITLYKKEIDIHFDER